MQGSLRLLTAVALSASLLTACGRKKQEQTESLPPVEQSSETAQVADPAASTPESAVQTPEAAPAAVEESSPKAEIPVPADSPTADASQGVPVEMAQADAAYEAWFRKYNLDLNDPQMLEADADGDGVSNGDEFMADTDPRDPKSLPPHAAAQVATVMPVEAQGKGNGLKLKQYNEVVLPVVLEGVEGNTAKIKHLDQEEKVETVRAGQTVSGLGLRVEKVQSRRMTDKHGAGVDASRVTLENPETKEKTVLVKDMPARSGSTYAVLVSEDGKTSITVRQGDTFEWPKESGNTFKVMDLRAEQTVLQEQSTGRMWTVLK